MEYLGYKCCFTPFRGFPDGSEDKESACNAGDPGSILGLGRSPGEGNGNPLQYSCLENPMDRGAWWDTVHGVAKSWTRLSDFTQFKPGLTDSLLYFKCVHHLRLETPEKTQSQGCENHVVYWEVEGAWKVEGNRETGKRRWMDNIGEGAFLSHLHGG